jgi:hypothetical protein
MQCAIAVDRQVEAPVVPHVPRDASLTVAAYRIREVERFLESRAAVARARKKDVATVRAARENDLLPQDVELARMLLRDDDARQPREYAGCARYVHRVLEAACPVGLENLEKDVARALVHPRDGGRAA